MTTTDTTFHWLMPSPVGELLLASNGDALTGLHFAGGRWELEIPEGSVEDESRFSEVVSQLEEYFNGERTDFELSLAPRGTEFQMKVWDALRTIPYGQTWSYAELARAIGQPNAFRAVGLAERQEPDRDHRAVPPSDRCQRQACRLRRRHGKQADPAQPRVGSAGVDAQLGRAFSTAATSAGSSGVTIGRNRSMTSPCGEMRNFSKFHCTSPALPSASAFCVSSEYSGCWPSPLTSSFS